MFLILAKINKLILPSFSKNQLDLAKAKKWQMALIGYRYFVTARSIKQQQTTHFVLKKEFYIKKQLLCGYY